jgi:RNA polymerase sigma-70 factor (ECF subfamily)
MIRRIAAARESNASAREDVVQDILCAIWRALPNFRGEGNLRAFIARAAANRAVTHVQRVLKLPAWAELTGDLLASGPGPEAHAIAVDERSIRFSIAPTMGATASSSPTQCVREAFSQSCDGLN